MEDLLPVLTVAGIHLVLVVTPGANFLMALSMAFITGCWYAFVAVSFSYPRIQALYAGFEYGINYLFGTLMIGFGLRILLTSD